MDRPPVNRPRDEARFDEELRRAARSLIREDLPRDLLDPVVAGSTRSLGGVTTRRALPGFAAAASAVAVLLVATAVALAPGGIQPAATGSGGPPASETLGMQVSPAPSSFALRPTSSLVSELTMLGYRCNDGKDLESPKAGEDAVVRESSICTAPDSAGPLVGAVVIGEAKGGRVVHLEVKANIVGDDTGEARRAVATMLAEAAALGPKPKDDGIYVKQWVLSKVPGLEKNEGVELQARGLSMRIFRSSTGSYALSMSGL
jgi:hypothetical protein